MTLSENNIKMYRAPEDINMLLEILIDSFFSSLESRAGKREAQIINKLKIIENEISHQFMNIFEAPLNNVDFKDLVSQLLKSLINEIVVKSVDLGILTETEGDLMNVFLSTNS